MDRPHSPPHHHPHSHKHHPKGHNSRHAHRRGSENSHDPRPTPTNPHHPRGPPGRNAFPPPTGPAWTSWQPAAGEPNRQDGHLTPPPDPLHGPAHPPYPPHPSMRGCHPPSFLGGTPYNGGLSWAPPPFLSSTRDGEEGGRRQGFQRVSHRTSSAIKIVAPKESAETESGEFDRGASAKSTGNGTPNCSEEGGEKRMRVGGEDVELSKRGFVREAKKRAALEQVTAELAQPHTLGLAMKGEEEIEHAKVAAGEDADTMEEEAEEEEGEEEKEKKEQEAVKKGQTGNGTGFKPQCFESADSERPREACPLLDTVARGRDSDGTHNPVIPQSHLPTPSTHISLSLGSKPVLKPAAQRAGPDPRVGEVLQRYNMSEYAGQLAEAWVDLEELHTLGEEGLRGLGLPAQAASQLAKNLEQGEVGGRDSEMEVFVAGAGLGQFVPMLTEAWVDMAELKSMEEGELVELGLPLGAAKRLRRAVLRILRTNDSCASPLIPYVAPSTPANIIPVAKPNAAKLEGLRDQILRSTGGVSVGGIGKGCGNGGGDMQPMLRRVPVQLLVPAADNTVKS